MAYKVKSQKKKNKEIDVFTFKKKPNMAKEGDVITFKSKEDGAIISNKYKIDEKYKQGNNIYFENYDDKSVVIYNKKTKRFI